MSCSNCKTQDNIKTLPTGCKNNGSCSTLSCDKKSVFDWLGNMSLPAHQTPFDIYEVRFKNGRKAYFKNVNDLPLCMGEAIAVEGNPGHDIGTISLSGELVKLQLEKRKIATDSEEIKKIYRKATDVDIETWEKARNREAGTQKEARIIIDKLGLKMKLSDVEYQGDGKKATFYYTAESRVDFRQLIKELASSFSIRIEMKQVDYRHEAGRLGGIGSCGRELCCSTWLTDFRKVNTSSARYQQLSLSPQKLQGQCGRLKCCLNYELDSYLDALQDFPDTETVLRTDKGNANFIKMDIFKRLLWYAYDQSDDYKWYCLTVEQVNEIITNNNKGKKASSLSDMEVLSETETNGFDNALEEDSLTRFDQPKKKRKNRRRKPRSNNQNDKNTQAQQSQKNEQKNRSKSKQRSKNKRRGNQNNDSKK